MADHSALERRLAREIAARKAAEQILENKSLELFEANQKLKGLNISLESDIEEKIEKLIESEKRFKVLVESAYDLIYVIDNNGFITYINKVIEEGGGFIAKEVIGTHFTEYVHENSIETVVENYLTMIEAKATSAYTEVLSLRKSGEPIWLGQNVQFSYKADGTLKEAIVIARDITQKKKEEDQLISTQLQLISLIENMHEGVLFHSTRGEILLINSFFCDFFECSIAPEELKGVNLNEVKDKFTAKIHDFEQKLKNLLKEPNTPKIGLEVRFTDNRFIKFDYIPIISSGKILGILWQFTDITDQKQLDLQIRNSEEKYRGVIENMDLGLMEVDNQGTILKVYEGFCRMTNYRPEELIGKNAENLLLPPEYKTVVKNNHEKRNRGEQSVYEVEMLKKNGERIWIIISGAPFFDLDGNIKGSLGIHFDITDQKRLQNELIAAKEIAEKAQIAEQKFLASMSHEIRTPLNAVIGMSHLLNDTPLNTEQKEYIDMMQYSANLLRNLVTDVLDFAKIESGELEVSNKPFDLIGLLKTLHKTFELKLIGKTVNIKVNHPKISKMIIGDETLINQVLYNLLGNAEKFTSRGEISLSADISKTSKNMLDVVFIIKDTGIGIHEDRQNEIFKEFKQESRETNVKYGGTGLGLSITKNIVETLGGEIWLESEKGIGTTFYVKLLLESSQKDIKNEQSVHSKVLSENSKILVVEDNVINQNYIRRILEKGGLEFDIASNGKEGFEWAKKLKYDLIIMDISMPVMDGYQSTIAIRNHSGPNKNTPIIALTASAMLNKKDKAFEIGMNDYMTKPFTPIELKGILAKYLDINESPESSTSSKKENNNTLLSQETLDIFYNGDDEYALEMFELFIRQYDEQIKLLKTLLKTNSYEEAQKIVHKMKPTFSMVGAPDVQKTFQVLEDKLRYKDQLGTKSSWIDAEVLLEKYIPAVNLELKRLQQLNQAVLKERSQTED